MTFAAIAEALAKQGVTQGEGENQKPITTSRLTALYSQMKRVDAKRSAGRRGRTDSIEPSLKDEQPHKVQRKVALAPELSPQPSPGRQEEQLPDEESIRRENLKRAQRFLKKPLL